MMHFNEKSPEWTLEEKKKLLELWKNEDDWPARSEKMSETFPTRKDFFSPETCEAEFDRLLSAPAPTQVTISTAESTPRYSLKAVVDMWIAHYEKEIIKYFDKELELCMVKIRNNYAQVERIVNNEYTPQQLKELLDQARVEDAKYGPEYNLIINNYMRRLMYIDQEKKKNRLPTDLIAKEEAMKMEITGIESFIEPRLVPAVPIKVEDDMEDKLDQIVPAKPQDAALIKIEEPIEIKIAETVPKEAKVEDFHKAKTMLTNTLNLIKGLRHSNIFLYPVTEKEAPGYSKVVKRPMDFMTIKKEIDAGEVSDVKQLKHRCLQMYANAVMYNNSGSNINTRAKEIARDTLEEMNRLHSTRPTRAQSIGTAMRRKRPSK